MIAALVAALAIATGAHSPKEAVQRFIENRSPADACAQLAPAYKKAIQAQYGPCVQGMQIQPKATHIRVYNQKVNGPNATVEARYDANGTSFHERYTCARSHGVWQITGSKQIP
jgi:hypothetical protein